MKKLLFLLLVLFAGLSARADFTTVYLSVTNTPTNGYTMTVNGATRTWTNNIVSSPATLIANTNTLGGCASNLFDQFQNNPFSGVQIVYHGTNGIDLKSTVALTVSVSTNWAALSTTVITTTNRNTVMVPWSGYNPTDQVTIASQLVSGLENSSTPFTSTNIALTNYDSLSQAQTITGKKTFTGPNILSNANQFITGGGLSNVAATNITWLGGSNGVYWALILVNPNLTNGQNFGTAFRSPGGGVGSEQFGLNAVADNSFSMAFGDGSHAIDISAMAFGFGATATNSAVALGIGTTALGYSSTAIGTSATTPFDFSSAFGYSATTTAPHQVRLGTSSENVSIPGGLQVDGAISNATVAGTLTLQNEFLTNRKNLTGLANGANSVATSTNTFLKVSGPSGAFSINGLSGGADGRHLIIQNSTGFTMTIANDSGTEPTAANRILTGTGADVSEANNPGCVSLIYDSAVSRWVLVSKN